MVCVFRVRVVGLERVPRAPYIVCFNHLGWAEAFLILLWFPTAPLLHGLGERDVMERSAFRRWLAKQIPIFLPLDCDKPREALRMMQDVLVRGGALAIAPEGKLGAQEGTIAELQTGAAHLSIRTGAPLLPAGATGTLELWLGKELTLRVGEPILPETAAGDTHTRVRTLTAELDVALRALLPGDTQAPRWKPLRAFLTKLL